MDTNQRSRLLIGQSGMEKLAQSTVLVAGLGGVGGICAEALARSGIGHLVLIDKDTVEASNVNRQICALHSTVGQEKTDILKRRIHDINPECQVSVFPQFYDKDMNEVLDKLPIDFVCDCIDSLRSKEDLIRYCQQRDIGLVCSMGMARRKNPAALEVMPLHKTSQDPMAKRLRIWAKKEGLKKPVMTVCSTEPAGPMCEGQPLPSMMMVPASAGLLIASACIEAILGKGEQK